VAALRPHFSAAFALLLRVAALAARTAIALPRWSATAPFSRVDFQNVQNVAPSDAGVVFRTMYGQLRILKSKGRMLHKVFWLDSGTWNTVDQAYGYSA
jgi:hypothetical protein